VLSYRIGPILIAFSMRSPLPVSIIEICLFPHENGSLQKGAVGIEVQE
jgi:hypothetical protein